MDCVICMAPVDCTNLKERMVTPCNHFFHRECLERWMEVKMECPTCRGGLPIVTEWLGREDVIVFGGMRPAQCRGGGGGGGS